MPRKLPPKRTRWKPGQSGNPNGRPKEVIEFREWIRTKLVDPKTLQSLWARAEKSDYLMRTMLEYGYGKPPQPVTGDEGGPIKVIVEYANRS